ncbi:MAG TPA: phosphatidylglycerol lysyltransferase domain-containing protein [Streptosporangiaceae bacterium]|nr:phosphatidylglycerol lysyltransferase domain-containing protein [Streptosporangiaceae bacterium]
MSETNDTSATRSAVAAGERDTPQSSATGGRVPDRRQQRRWVPFLSGWVCLLIGLADIIGALGPGVHHVMERRLHRITPYVPGVLTNVSHSAFVVIGLLLIMMSRGLRKRKRRAWQAATLLLAFSVVIHVVHAPYKASGLAAAVVLAALLVFRNEFYAVGDPATLRRAAGIFVAMVGADVAIGLSYLFVAKGLATNYSLWQRMVDVVYGLVGVSGPGIQFVPEGRQDGFNILTTALGLLTVAVSGYLFFRSARPKSRLTEQNAHQIRELLSRQGDRDSLGYFALRDDKSVVWSPTGKSCVCYRVVAGVMLASADPLGDPEAWPGAIQAFLDEAARHAWIPAVMGCSELGAEIWCRESGMTALELGDEAVVEVGDFSLQGRQMRNVRQMVSRVCRAGYSVQIRRVSEIPAGELDQLMDRADSWRGSPTERGFSMALGRVGGPDDGDCVVATATENGVLRALLHFVPWGSDGLSLDLMRRERTAQPGVNDFMIVETIKQAQELGIKRLSLNFAVFRAVLARGERIGAGPVLRAWRRVLLFVSRWFQIESLYKFNAKFCPLWVPRFFVFPGPADAMRVGLAALEAEALLVWPSLEIRRIARKLRLRRLSKRLPRAVRRLAARPVNSGPPSTQGDVRRIIGG